MATPHYNQHLKYTNFQLELWDHFSIPKYKLIHYPHIVSQHKNVTHSWFTWKILLRHPAQEKETQQHLGQNLPFLFCLLPAGDAHVLLSTSPSSELLLHQQEQNQAPGTTGVLTVLPRTQHIAMNTYKVWCISSKTKYIPKTQETE